MSTAPTRKPTTSVWLMAKEIPFAIGTGYTVDLCCSPESPKVYAAVSARGVVAVIDGLGDTVAAELHPGSEPTRLCFDSVVSQVFCTQRFGHDVAVIDAVRDSVVSHVTVGDYPSDLCLYPNLGRVLQF